MCTPRAGNPGNVLLTCRNPPKYTYQFSVWGRLKAHRFIDYIFLFLFSFLYWQKKNGALVARSLARVICVLQYRRPWSHLRSILGWLYLKSCFLFTHNLQTTAQNPRSSSWLTVNRLQCFFGFFFWRRGRKWNYSLRFTCLFQYA